MLQLEVISGKSIGKRATFSSRVVRIGTAAENDFQLDDELASRNHGIFVVRPGHNSYVYRDLLSTHGSRVHTNATDVVLLDHQVPQSVLLSHEVIIHVGRSTIKCLCRADEPEDSCDKVSLIEEVSCKGNTGISASKEVEQLLGSLREVAYKTSLRDTFKSMIDSAFAYAPDIDHGTIWQCDRDRCIFSCAFERMRRQQQGTASVGLTQFKKALEKDESTLLLVNRMSGEKIVPSNVLIIPVCEEFFSETIVVFESLKPITHGMIGWLIELVKNASISAARTYQNADLYDVLDGFIRSTISAFDTRDPASAGHSTRVSNYVLMTAHVIDSQTTGPFASTSFSRDEFDELRYAALLHDIGKISVREEIVLKSGRLFPRDYTSLLERIDLFSAWFETQTPEKLGAAWRSQETFAHYRELVGRLQHADAPIMDADRAYMEEMRKTFITTRPTLPLLSANEHKNLLIPYGTLNADERRDIQQHALISWRYLSRILWPRRWSRVPSFVLQHHEKLNGTGYPYGISGEAIFLQSRILTVCDIFDALTGGDRPYKQRHSFSEAAEILIRDADRGALDKDVTNLFIEQVLPQICDLDSSYAELSSAGIPSMA